MDEKRKYKYILFDLDGTLIYSHKGIFRCIALALEKLHLPAPTEAQLKQCIGPSLMYSFTHYFGLDEETARQATVKYREEYAVTGVYENEEILGAKQTLETLQKAGYVLGMATSKPKIFAEKIADRLGFSPYLTALVGSGTDGSLHTKALVIEEALRRLGAEAKECLMVGDRRHDLEGAREWGMDCALLKVGYAPLGEFEEVKPEYVFDDLAALTEFLTK